MVVVVVVVVGSAHGALLGCFLGVLGCLDCQVLLPGAAGLPRLAHIQPGVGSLSPEGRSVVCVSGVCGAQCVVA